MDINSPGEHISVLAETIAEQVSLPKDGVLVDATLGHGGHSFLLGKQMGPGGTILGLDIDGNSISRAQQQLSSLSCKVLLVRENFSQISEIMSRNGIAGADLILADLGFCSAQLSDPKKGLSFQENMALDMRLDDRLGRTAADIVNYEDENIIADLIYQYGQERGSRRIARFIAEYRKTQPIKSTGQLAMIVCKALNQPATSRKSRVHPATKTFQALRIAVNDELGCLETLLEDSPSLLKEGGLIGIISFHSLEDRIVKFNFKDNAQKGVYEILTKKPLVATRQEIMLNPRSRSAKLRIARRTAG